MKYIKVNIQELLANTGELEQKAIYISSLIPNLTFKYGISHKDLKNTEKWFFDGERIKKYLEFYIEE